jgi:hypothetical protein
LLINLNIHDIRNKKCQKALDRINYKSGINFVLFTLEVSTGGMGKEKYADSLGVKISMPGGTDNRYCNAMGNGKSKN